MHTTALQFYVLLLAAVVGYMLLARLPEQLLPSMTAFVAAVVGASLVGAVLALGAARNSAAHALGFVSVVAATASLVCGFVIVDRTLPAGDDADASRTNDGP